jgi:predicted ATPase
VTPATRHLPKETRASYVLAVKVLPLAPAMRLVGREAELAALLHRLESARASSGAIVILAGEAGIGKTRLARELIERATARGIETAWATCYEGEWHRPYGPWLELAGRLGAVPEPPDRGLSPEDARFRMYESLVACFTASESARLIVLDDVHWADQRTLVVGVSPSGLSASNSRVWHQNVSGIVGESESVTGSEGDRR